MNAREVEDYVAGLKVTQLREELKKRNLSTAGNKSTLVQRLQEGILNTQTEGEVTNGGDGEGAKPVEVSAGDQEGDEEAAEGASEEEAEESEEAQQEEVQEGASEEYEVVMDQIVQTEGSGTEIAQGGH